MRRLVSLALLASGAVAAVAAPASADPPVTSTTVAASEDTYVVQESPTTIRGAESKITAAMWSNWHTHAFLRFVVPAHPAGRPITSVRLDLSYEKLTQQAPVTELRAVVGGWSEATTTYATRPGLGAVLATAILPAPGVTSLSFPLTGVVSGPGEVNFALTNPGTNSVTSVFSHEQGASGPRLTIEYEARPTLFGASFSLDGQTYAQALAREDALFNGLDVVRVFYSGAPPAWTGSKADQVGPRTVVISFKLPPAEVLAGQHDASLASWFASVPTDRDVYWSYWHEPEDNIAAGEFSAVSYRAAWQRIRQIEDGVGNPRLFATLVLMRWSLLPASGRNWRDYYAGSGVVDVLAWDAYNSAAPSGGYIDPAVFLAEILAASQQEQKPFAIAELGSHIAAGDDGTGRAAWLNALGAQLIGNGAYWVAYFDHDWSTGDYRIRDAVGVAVWNDLCTQPN